jgi:hypothetical protein
LGADNQEFLGVPQMTADGYLPCDIWAFSAKKDKAHRKFEDDGVLSPSRFWARITKNF